MSSLAGVTPVLQPQPEMSPVSFEPPPSKPVSVAPVPSASNVVASALPLPVGCPLALNNVAQSSGGVVAALWAMFPSSSKPEMLGLALEANGITTNTLAIPAPTTHSQRG